MYDTRSCQLLQGNLPVGKFLSYTTQAGINAELFRTLPARQS